MVDRMTPGAPPPDGEAQINDPRRRQDTGAWLGNCLHNHIVQNDSAARAVTSGRGGEQQASAESGRCERAGINDPIAVRRTIGRSRMDNAVCQQLASASQVGHSYICRADSSLNWIIGVSKRE